VVDDAIVVLENVERIMHEEGLEPRDDAHWPILARAGTDPGGPDERGTNGVRGGTNAPVGSSGACSVYSGS